MAWVIRTYHSKGAVAFGNTSSLILDKEFETKEDALDYRSTLKEYSEIFEITRLERWWNSTFFFDNQIEMWYNFVIFLEKVVFNEIYL